MFVKSWILLAACLAVAYAAIEPLDLTAIESTQDVAKPEQHLREKRFILAKKALLVGGAVGLGVGLVKGSLIAGALNRPSYYQPSYGGYGGYGGSGRGWSGSSASASASAFASSW